MQKSVLIAIANGTEEVEAVTPIDLLRRAGADVLVAGETNIITCSRKVTIVADVLLSSVDDTSVFDAIILPGGKVGTEFLKNSVKLVNILKAHREKKALIAAICAAPTILLANNLLNKSHKITAHPSVEAELAEYEYLHQPVVFDDNILTSQGAGTTMDFSFKLIELLFGESTAARVANDIVYSI